MKDLNKIRMLSYRLVGGVQGKGINLTLLYIPDLSRYHIRRLVRAGYGDLNSFKDASEVELGKLIPKRLVQKIQKKMKEENNHQKMLKAKWIVQDEKLKVYKKVSEECGVRGGERQLTAASPVTLLEPILEISQRRPDRIIFMGKKIELTAREFSLIYFLAQHNSQVLSYDTILDELWKNEEDAFYSRVSYHVSNIKKALLKTIGEDETNIKRIRNILVVVPGRGVMLNLKDEELLINRQYVHATAS